MSVVINISKTYRKPIQTYSRLFELGASEKQNLAFLIGGCVISFVSQWPVQARHAFANQQSIDVGIVEGFFGKNFHYFIVAGFWLLIFLTFVYSGFKGRSR